MKRIGLYSLLVMAILFTGCAQKELEVDANAAGTETIVEKDSSASSETSLSQVATNDSISQSDDMKMADNGVYVTINGEKVFLESVYFAFDKYDVSSDMRDVIKTNASVLSSFGGKVKVEGNCDEWGSDEYNYALGLKRANAVKDALIADGVEASNISLISFGESNPICTDKNSECWQKNRRAEHRLLP